MYNKNNNKKILFIKFVSCNVVLPNTNDMKNLTINNKTYEPQIEGENIELIGLDDMITLVGAGSEFNELAEEEATYYYKDHDGENYYTAKDIDKDVYNDYVRNYLVDFCNDWVKSGQEMTVENFNLN